MKYLSDKGKLRDLVCFVCNKKYQKHITPSNIKSGRGKVCSRDCKNKWNGLLKTRGEWRSCKKCGKKIWARPSNDRRGNIRSYCSVKCHGSEWKERKMSTDGYWIIHTPDGGEMKEHRWIMAQHLKRKLLPSEIVHHLNHDKLDNRLENLSVVSRSEHNKIHGFLRREKGGCHGKEKVVVMTRNN